MLDARISFLRHSPRHFPEGKLVLYKFVFFVVGFGSFSWCYAWLGNFLFYVMPGFDLLGRSNGL